jgi:hypothetical protein
MKSLNKGYVQNFQEQKVGIAFDLRQTKISPLRGLKNPELYVRYFAKLGMVLGGCSHLINIPFYWYTKILNHL